MTMCETASLIPVHTRRASLARFRFHLQFASQTKQRVENDRLDWIGLDWIGLDPSETTMGFM